MQARWNTDPARPLHVLVVDEDPTSLKSSCVRLLNEGHEVSTRREGRGLADSLSRLQPDIVLVDVLMRDLEGDELFLLLARCSPTGTPCVILHTRLSMRMLREVVDIHDALGVIHKTTNDGEFAFAFNALLERLRAPEQSVHGRYARRSITSGTHRIFTDSTPAAPIALRKA